MASDTHSLLKGFELDGWTVEPLNGIIRSPDGQETHVTPKAMDVLVCLASRAGDTVERATIFDEVWGSLPHSEESLTHCVGELRKAFHDRHDSPEFVQTVPKRGYRLVAELNGGNAPPTTELRAEETPKKVGFLERQLGNLRRRKVFQAVIGYPVIAWLLVQIADVLWEYLLEPLGAPPWIVPTLVVLLAVGYPIAIFLAWAVDLTPDGVQVTVDEEGTKSPLAGIAILGVGSVSATVVALVLYFGGIEPPPPPPPAPPPVIPYTPPDDSIAVLRFLNIHNNPAIQYLGDGLTEELIHELTNIGNLKVAARTSVWPYLDADMKAPEIAEELNVDKVLEGSVRSDGDTIRVTVQLIDRNGFHLWSEVYDTQTQGILDIQKDIAVRVVGELDTILNKDDQERLESRPTMSSEAYDSYLRGRAQLRQPSTEEALAAAWASFEQAIEIDPRFSLAYAGACETHLANYRRTRDTSYFEKAEIACHRALTLDGGLAEVYTALGNLYRHFGEPEKAEEQYSKALEINPMMEEATFGLGRSYQAQGRIDEAEEVLLRTVILEPSYWGTHMGVGNFLHRQGRFEEAIPYYEEVTRLEPEYAGGYINLGSAHHWLGNWEEAELAFRRATELRPDSMAYQNLGTTMYYLQRFDDAVEMHTQATEMAPSDYRARGKLAAAQSMIAGLEEQSAENFRHAISLANEQLAINPNDGETLAYLAYYLARIDETEEARATIGRALEILPEDPNTRYFAAIVSNRAGDEEQALTELEAAVRHGYSLRSLEIDPQIQNLSSNRRYRELLQGE